MQIKLQSMLQQLAAENGIEDSNGWPMLQSYLFWILNSAGISQSDANCPLFWKIGPTDSARDYHGLNLSVLIDRLAIIHGCYAVKPSLYTRLDSLINDLKDVALNPATHTLLQDVMTTTEYAIRFILTNPAGLKIPMGIMTSPGRKADSNFKSLAIEQFLILKATGTRFPARGGLTAASRVVYEMLGGRIALDSIADHIRDEYSQAFA